MLDRDVMAVSPTTIYRVPKMPASPGPCAQFWPGVNQALRTARLHSVVGYLTLEDKLLSMNRIIIADSDRKLA